MSKKTKPEIIRSVKDGDKMVLNYPDYTREQLHREYVWFYTRACEINNADGWKHYRVSKLTELGQIVIIAERREEDGDHNEARRS